MGSGGGIAGHGRYFFKKLIFSAHFLGLIRKAICTQFKMTKGGGTEKIGAFIYTLYEIFNGCTCYCCYYFYLDWLCGTCDDVDGGFVGLKPCHNLDVG